MLLLQIGSAFFKLPGGRLRPGEGEVEGLLRKLNTAMAPEADHLKPDWRVGEVLGTYFRPNFENIMYPYCPPHIARPKEVRRLFLVHLPEKCFLAVPKNYKLVAVPLFEIYDHMQRYGPVISAIPQLLSRFNIVLAGRGGDAVAPGAQMPVYGEHRPDQVAANQGTLAVGFHQQQQPQQQQQQQMRPRDEDFTIDFD